MDAQLDYESLELKQWSHLSDAFTLPALSMATIRKIPLLGRYASCRRHSTSVLESFALSGSFGHPAIVERLYQEPLASGAC